MKFIEDDCIELPKFEDVFVYFLLKDGEVIYVGQTISGIIRPLMQKKKNYDCIKIKYCKKEELNNVENYYILKYRPKLNKIHNPSAMYSLFKIRQIVREKTKNEKFNVRDLKKVIKLLNIEMINRVGDKDNHNKLICIEDFNKIVEYILQNGTREPNCHLADTKQA